MITNQESVPNTTGSFNDAFSYSSDVLLTDQELINAKIKFGSVAILLDDSRLRAEFLRTDTRANNAKTASRKYGFIAVVCATVALCGAAAEPIISDLPWAAQVAITLFLAGLGIFALALSLGWVLRGGRKREWLKDRLKTERLRQFYFQRFLCDWDTLYLVESAPDEFKAKQKLWLTHMQSEYSNLDDKLAEIMEKPNHTFCWFQDFNENMPYSFSSTRQPIHIKDENVSEHSSISTLQSSFFSAYKTLRFEHQIKYCQTRLNLGRGRRGFLNKSLLQQQYILKNYWSIVITLFVALHILLIGTLATSIFLPEIRELLHHWSPFLHLFIIWLAIIAIAIRTVEHGMGIHSDIERFRNYKGKVEALQAEFDIAQAPNEKHHVMRSMEEVVYNEMCDFIKIHNEAKFVM